MAFPKGRKRPEGAGRKKGIPNKVTTKAREAFALAFDDIGGGKALAQWAEENQTEFYKLYARLIPVDHTSGEKPIAPTQRIKIGNATIEF